MLSSVYNGYDELPVFLNSKMVADLLGVSATSAYFLMKSDNFPALRIGTRIVVPKDKFLNWVENNTNG